MEAIRTSPSDDLREFDQLVMRHKRQVWSNCRYLTRSEADADDLAQEVFLKAYFRLSTFEGRSKFRTWLHTIKTRHCLDHLKKGRGRVFVDVEDPAVASTPELSQTTTPETILAEQREQTRIGAVLDRLPEPLRVPLIMRDLDGMAYQQIAEELDLGLSAVKMRIMRGRREFRRMFRGDPSDKVKGDSEAPAGGARR